ncbi:MAG: hypothetical protein R3B96_01650 [Pirellulaceae bacterium]
MGTIKGSPNYMSPEQALGRTGKLIGPNVDVFGLGATLYAILTGKAPALVATKEERDLPGGKVKFTPPRQVIPQILRAEAICWKAMRLTAEGSLCDSFGTRRGSRSLARR